MSSQFKLASGVERLPWKQSNKPPTPLYGTFLSTSHRKKKYKAPLKPMPEPKQMMNTINLMIETSSDIRHLQTKDLQQRARSLSNGKSEENKHGCSSAMKRILFTFSNEGSPQIRMPTSKPNLPRPLHTDRSISKPVNEMINLIKRPMNSSSAAQLLPTSTRSRESSLERYRELDAAINSMVINTRGRRETLNENTKPQRPPEPKPAGAQARQGRFIRNFHSRPKVHDIYPHETIKSSSPVTMAAIAPKAPKVPIANVAPKVPIANVAPNVTIANIAPKAPIANVDSMTTIANIAPVQTASLPSAPDLQPAYKNQ